MLTVSNRLDELLEDESDEVNAEEQNKDIICKVKLQLFVSGPLRDIISRTRTAKEAWELLHTWYVGGLDAKKPKPMGDLHMLEQGGKSMV
jgi:hypothetical protein